MSECEEEEEECEVIHSDDEWLKKQEEALKHIKDFNPKNDRLVSTTQLSYMHNALASSVLSWNNCINGWVSLELGNKINVGGNEDMVTLTDEEFKDLYTKNREFTIKFIELDIAITKTFLSKASQKKKEIVKKSKPRNEAKMVV